MQTVAYNNIEYQKLTCALATLKPVMLKTLSSEFTVIFTLTSSE